MMNINRINRACGHCALLAAAWGLIAVSSLFAAGAEVFSVIALPDTQSAIHSYPQVFKAQTQWIVDNLATANVAFVSHEGDIVQNGGDESEWQNADAAMDTLDTVPSLPYSAVTGNHDYGGPGKGYYVQYFGPSRYSGRSWFEGSSADNDNHCQTFRGGGRTFLHLGLGWLVSDWVSARAWAQGVIDAHTGMPTIITTHEYLDATGSYSGNGQTIFNELVFPNPQVFMVLCGHESEEGRRISTNDAGQVAFEMLANYQGRANGGDAWLRIITFDEDNSKIRVRTYSPTLDQYETDANSQFEFTVNFDRRFGKD